MKIFKEFKEFAVRGNLIDTAVAFVMGAAFGKIVSTFVGDIVMPVIGLLSSGQDFTEMKWILKAPIAEQKDAAGNIIQPAMAEVAIKYGTFITVVLDFIIVAFAVFLVVKAINSFKRKEETAPTAPPAPTREEVLLTEIRDLLSKK